MGAKFYLKLKHNYQYTKGKFRNSQTGFYILYSDDLRERSPRIGPWKELSLVSDQIL